MGGAENVQYLSNGVDDANIFGWRLDKLSFYFKWQGKCLRISYFHFLFLSICPLFSGVVLILKDNKWKVEAPWRHAACNKPGGPLGELSTHYVRISMHLVGLWCGCWMESEQEIAFCAEAQCKLLGRIRAVYLGDARTAGFVYLWKPVSLCHMLAGIWLDKHTYIHRG